MSRAVPPLVESPATNGPWSAPASAITRKHLSRLDTNTDSQHRPHDISPMTPQTPFAHVDDRSVSPIDSIHRQTITFLDRAVPNHHFREPYETSSPNNDRLMKYDTTSNAPRPNAVPEASAVQPTSQPVELQYPQLKERTKQLLADLRERNTARQTSGSSLSSAVEENRRDVPISRKPLRDRSVDEIVSIYANEHTTTPSSTAPGLQKDASTSNTYHDVTTQPVLSISSSGSPTASPSLSSTSSTESLKPVVPLKMNRRTASEGSPLKPGDVHPAFRTPIIDQARLDSPFQTPHQQQELPDAVPKHQQARNDSPDYEDEPRTPTTPVQVHPFELDKTSPYTTSRLEPHIEHEVSRFSWTTYTSTNADSPQSTARFVRGYSPASPIAELPAPIAIRKRPMGASLFSELQSDTPGTPRSVSSPIARKPVPKMVDKSQFSVSTSSRASDVSKSLPPIPTELGAEDKVASLEAQIGALERRKRNIARIIYDLRQSLVRNPVTCDLWRRREIDKRIANQQLEMDDVANDMHELNLILHRARRKRDKDDNYEQPTGLWVKRVTS